MSRLARSLAVCIALTLAACASNPPFEDGKKLLGEGKTEAGLARLAQAVQEFPDDGEARRYYLAVRDIVAGDLTAQADALANQGRYDAAEDLYAKALAANPGHAPSLAGLERARRERRHAPLLAAAREAAARGDLAAAEAPARAVLRENPGNLEARRLMARVGEARSAAEAPPRVLTDMLSRKVTLEFREATLKSVFEVLSRTAGVNFVFDRDVRQDTKVTIFVRESSIDDVIKLITLTNQLERKVLNDNSLLIYPATAAKQKDYQDLVVRTFFLANADAKSAQNLIKTMVKSKDVYVDEKLNLLVIKDTPEAIRLAEKLLALQDVAEPEVMLQVEVMEVGSGTLLDLGVTWPSAVNIGVPGATTAPGGGVGGGSGGLPDTVVLDSTTSLKAFVANPVAVINLRQQDRTQSLLADPRIRVRNRDKAKVLIGEKVPVVTTTSTANVGVSSNVSYLDVGLTLEVEPLISLDDEVSIKVGLEVSNILETVVFAGAQAFRLGRRTAATSLRLKDGETAVLAGLISADERKTRVKVPGLGDLPALGRLFASDNDASSRTEIVLLITPRIVRNIGRPELLQTQFPSGTESAVGVPPLTIRTTPPQGLGLSSRAPRGAAAAEAPAAPPPPAAAASPAPAATQPVAVTLAAPVQVRSGQEFTVTVALPPGAGSGATLELIYDPQVLGEVTAASSVTVGPGGLAGGSNPPPQAQAVPGRVPLTLTRGDGGAPASAQVRFRVLSGDAATTQLSVDRLLVQDAGGNPLPFVDPAPLRLAVSQ